MKTFKAMLAPIAVGALVLALAGCDTERDKGGQMRATLKAGQKVSNDMTGWVALPGATEPNIKKDDSKGISYAVLGANNLVPYALNNWVAINPAFFTKLTEITVEAPKESGDLFVLSPKGIRVPADKNGWVAVPYNSPKIESSATRKDRELAKLSAEDVIPKEMNGWVAVDKDTLANLVDKFMKTGPGAKVSDK